MNNNNNKDDVNSIVNSFFEQHKDPKGFLSNVLDQTKSKESELNVTEELMNLRKMFTSGFMFYHNRWKKKQPPYKLFETELLTGEDSLEEFSTYLFGPSTITLILGERGSGKTGFGMKLLEAFDRNSDKGCYAIGYDDAKLPSWINKVQSVDSVPHNSVVLIDEGGIVLSSRNSQSELNKRMSKLMFIARHKNLSLIFVTQNSANIDVNVVRQADVLIFKQISEMQISFDRGPMKEWLIEANRYLSPLKGIDYKKGLYIRVMAGPAKRFRGFFKAGLPEFWNNEISESFKNI